MAKPPKFKMLDVFFPRVPGVPDVSDKMTSKAQCLRINPYITLEKYPAIKFPGKTTTSVRYKKRKSYTYRLSTKSFAVEASTEVEVWQKMLKLLNAHYCMIAALIICPPLASLIPAMINFRKSK